MARTTILIQDDLLLEVRRVARTQGTTLTEVIKNALKAYVERQPSAGLPSFTGVVPAGSRGKKSLGRNAKAITRRAVDPFEGSAREGER
jgi:hypothetical protein